MTERSASNIDNPSAGATHIYLAGRPKEPAPYNASGVKEFIYAGCGALATLQAAHVMIAGPR